ncbi:hypothetical protein CEXT_257051 [Caerostris extrusa]|uniref:Uncharacterized protein n=1 Tax=Caerostris extrusa TaxID=172846 RepID=A0AAV4W0K5_CAEEX|nr:hypothetical protein CEXT_257051 [Caerostris extrusa]
MAAIENQLLFNRDGIAVHRRTKYSQKRRLELRNPAIGEESIHSWVSSSLCLGGDPGGTADGIGYYAPNSLIPRI